MQVNNNKPVGLRQAFRDIRKDFKNTTSRRRDVVSTNPMGMGRAPITGVKIITIASNFMWWLMHGLPNSIKRRPTN